MDIRVFQVSRSSPCLTDWGTLEQLTVTVTPYADSDSEGVNVIPYFIPEVLSVSFCEVIRTQWSRGHFPPLGRLHCRKLVAVEVALYSGVTYS
jgi:hypothetical protein